MTAPVSLIRTCMMFLYANSGKEKPNLLYLALHSTVGFGMPNASEAALAVTK
jgi:hypothetical protein